MREDYNLQYKKYALGWLKRVIVAVVAIAVFSAIHPLIGVTAILVALPLLVIMLYESIAKMIRESFEDIEELPDLEGVDDDTGRDQPESERSTLGDERSQA